MGGFNDRQRGTHHSGPTLRDTHRPYRRTHRRLHRPRKRHRRHHHPSRADFRWATQGNCQHIRHRRLRRTVARHRPAHHRHRCRSRRFRRVSPGRDPRRHRLRHRRSRWYTPVRVRQSWVRPVGWPPEGMRHTRWVARHRQRRRVVGLGPEGTGLTILAVHHHRCGHRKIKHTTDSTSPAAAFQQLGPFWV